MAILTILKSNRPIKKFRKAETLKNWLTDTFKTNIEQFRFRQKFKGDFIYIWLNDKYTGYTMTGIDLKR